MTESPSHDNRMPADHISPRRFEEGYPLSAATPPRPRSDRGTRPLQVLFVCTANICRSAYADLLANSSGISGAQFTSAGTHALVGHPIDPPMAARLPRDVDWAGHRARQLTRGIAERADLIIAMSERHREYVLDEWPVLARRTFLIGQVAREMRTMPLEVPLSAATEHLWRNRTRQSGDSIRDPYGRGDQAAAECAARIDAMLGEILDRIQRSELGRSVP